MKIIHCADLHLDANMQSRLSSDMARQRREELLYTFEKLANQAEETGAKVVLIAGDLFDTGRVRKTAVRRVLEIIDAHPDIDFLYLRGNHDDALFLEGDGTPFPANLKRFSEQEWTAYDYGEVVIWGIELAPENQDTYAQLLVPDPSRINIVTLHGQESDYEGTDDTSRIVLPQLRNRGIDYLALGHIHSFKTGRLDDRGIWCYAGCLEGRGFDECGPKGYVEVDIEDGQVSHTFVPFARRSFHEVPISVTPEDDMPGLLAKAEEALVSIPPTDLVRVLVTGKFSEDHPVEPRRLISRYEDRFFYFDVKDKSRLHVDFSRFARDLSLRGEFARLLEEQDLPEETKSAVFSLGMAALSGEDLEEA